MGEIISGLLHHMYNFDEEWGISQIFFHLNQLAISAVLTGAFTSELSLKMYNFIVWHHNSRYRADIYYAPWSPLQVSGGQNTGSRRCGPRPGAHWSWPEHRYATLPSRHRLHCLLPHLGFPVHWDAEWEAMELPGDLWHLIPKGNTLSAFAVAKHTGFSLEIFFFYCVHVWLCFRRTTLE